MIIGGLLSSSGALAGKGGIPWCESQLSECLIDLEAAQAFPATGQTSCWDIPCDGTGYDGDIRAGAVLLYSDTGLTIIDNNTGLEWMKQDNNNGDCASFPGYLDMACRFTWEEAFALVATLNTEPCFAEYCDWRVPNIKELQSIVNYENYFPAVSDEFNTGGVAGCTVDTCSLTDSVFYWSSTSDASTPPLAWGVIFNFGDVGVYDKDGEFLGGGACGSRWPVIDHWMIRAI